MFGTFGFHSEESQVSGALQQVEGGTLLSPLHLTPRIGSKGQLMALAGEPNMFLMVGHLGPSCCEAAVHPLVHHAVLGYNINYYLHYKLISIIATVSNDIYQHYLAKLNIRKKHMPPSVSVTATESGVASGFS